MTTKWLNIHPCQFDPYMNKLFKYLKKSSARFRCVSTWMSDSLGIHSAVYLLTDSSKEDKGCLCSKKDNGHGCQGVPLSGVIC